MAKKMTKAERSKKLKKLGIPEEFVGLGKFPHARTVKEAIEHLSKLPPELEFRHAWDGEKDAGALLVVINVFEPEGGFATFDSPGED